VDDHEFGVTHIVRGIDLQDSAKRQRFVYDYFDWEYPEVVHWGHVQLDAYDVSMSTSTIKELIEAGDLDGWDDPRAPTVASLRRRGIRGDAIVDALVELGTSTTDVDLAMDSVYAKNRERVDPEADRYFAVRDPVEVPLSGGPDVAEVPRHPENDRGERAIPTGDSVLIEADDRPAHGDRVWLKGLGCVEHVRDAFRFTGDDIEVVREEGVDVVHWVPAAETVPVEVRTMDGTVEASAEPAFSMADRDEVVQFERYGFVRVDDAASVPRVAYYTHP
jgi:glutamyl-tRNA synthetase